MRTKADLPTDEWNRLVQLPKWVAAAASAAQQDLAYRTNIETEVGLIAVARGRNNDNPFVATVAGEALAIYDDRALARAVDFTDKKAGIAAVLDLAGVVSQILDSKIDQAEATAYRQWLLAITDAVIAAARTGGFLGFGGKRVTELESSFRDRLAAQLNAA